MVSYIQIVHMNFKIVHLKPPFASFVNATFTSISWTPKVLNLTTFLTTLSQVVALSESL
jgi:hypothetical protein